MERDEQVYQELLKFFRALKIFGLSSFVVLSIYLAVYITFVHFQPLFNKIH
jgi:hypothetical protein